MKMKNIICDKEPNTYWSYRNDQKFNFRFYFVNNKIRLLLKICFVYKSFQTMYCIVIHVELNFVNILQSKSKFKIRIRLKYFLN